MNQLKMEDVRVGMVLTSIHPATVGMQVAVTNLRDGGFCYKRLDGKPIVLLEGKPIYGAFHSGFQGIAQFTHRGEYVIVDHGISEDIKRMIGLAPIIA